MKKEYKEDCNRDQFKELIKETKLEASENLKFRIMQQIESEKALSQNKVSNNFNPLLKTILIILSIMYTSIICLGITFYSIYGKSGLESSSLLLSIIGVASVCSLYGFISVYDEKRRYNNTKRSL